MPPTKAKNKRTADESTEEPENTKRPRTTRNTPTPNGQPPRHTRSRGTVEFPEGMQDSGSSKRAKGSKRKDQNSPNVAKPGGSGPKGSSSSKSVQPTETKPDPKQRARTGKPRSKGSDASNTVEPTGTKPKARGRRKNLEPPPQSPPPVVGPTETEEQNTEQQVQAPNSPSHSESSIASSTTGFNFGKALADAEQAASSRIARFSQGQRSHCLEDDFLSRKDVLLAIASVWVEQNERPKEDRFVYGNKELFALRTFEDDRNAHQSAAPAGDGWRLILPLMIDDDHVAQNQANSTGKASSKANTPPKPKKGQKLKPLTVLAVVTILNETSSPRLTFYYCNEGGESPEPNETEKRILEEAAAAQISRWDKANFSGEGNARIEDTTWRSCPTAATDAGVSTMRMSLVLNAWAVIWQMMPKSSGPPANAATPYDTFYVRARKLINLALQGRLRANLLNKFLREQGYIDLQASPSECTDHTSILMNSLIFRRVTQAASFNQLQEMLKDSNHLWKLQPQPTQLDEPRRSMPESPRAENTAGNGAEEDQEPRHHPGTIQGHLNAKTVKSPLQPKTRKRRRDEWKKLYRSKIQSAIGDYGYCLSEKGVELPKGSKAPKPKRQFLTKEWIEDQEIDDILSPLWAALWRENYPCAYAHSWAISTCVASNESDPTLEITSSWQFPGRDQDSLMMVATGAGRDFQRVHAWGNEAQNEALDDTRHHVLAIAERFPGSKKSEWVVDITIYDSLGEHAGAFHQVEEYVKKSGWLGIDAEGKPSKPTPAVEFRERKFARCAEQTTGGHCGLHVVLNAWAYMLHIPVMPCRRQLGFNATMELGLMCHLAERGVLDTLFIQAFMMVYDYSTLEFQESGQEVVDIIVNIESGELQGERERKRKWNTQPISEEEFQQDQANMEGPLKMYAEDMRAVVQQIKGNTWNSSKEN